MEAQLSSIRAIEKVDVNDDGMEDLLLFGNDTDYTPQFSRLDANRGTLLMNLGNGDFKAISNQKSGLNVKGDVRDIETIKLNNQDIIIVAVNNSKPVIIQLNQK